MPFASHTWRRSSNDMTLTKIASRIDPSCRPQPCNASMTTVSVTVARKQPLWLISPVSNYDDENDMARNTRDSQTGLS